MRSEVMGKTLAMFMVIAMVATVMVAFSPNVAATDPTVKGTVRSSVSPFGVIDGVNVMYHGDSGLFVNATTNAQGDFSILIVGGAKENFNLTFTSEKYVDRTVAFGASIYIGDTAMTNDTGLVPLPKITGIVKELGTDIPLQDVKITIDGDIEMTGSDGSFEKYVAVGSYTISYMKKGYFNFQNETVNVVADKNVGIIYLEKIVPTPTIKVNGIVYGDGGYTNPLSGALVSITEGDDKWITAISDDNGYYTMYAYPGNYQIKASLAGYFTTFDESYFFTVSNDKSTRQDIQLFKIGNEDQTVDGTITDSVTLGPLDGADVYLYSTDGKYVKHTTTDASGDYTMDVYTGDFVLVVSMDGYFTDASTTGITGTSTHDVALDPITQNFTLSGYVFDKEDDSTIAGATVTLYSTDYLYTNEAETGDNGYYEFNVSTSSDYAIVVDAEGYQSEIYMAESITDNRNVEANLYPSGEDLIETTFTFENWDKIQVQKFKTLDVDNNTARLNADRKWGMGNIGFELNDGNLDAGEVADWETYLEQKGAEQEDTADFLVLDNLYYELEKVGNVTAYDVSVDGAEGPLASGNTIYINSTYNYTLVGELDDADADMFELIFNASYDSDFENYVYEIVLPATPMFEMTNSLTETNSVEVMGYNNPITIDPFMLDEDTETVTMTLERSMNGTAKASIVNGDHYYVLNSTYDNYTVIVAHGGLADKDTNITFSAQDSTDKIGDIEMANFTWDFGDGTMGYGMEVEHDFTTVSGDVTVTLTITETGGNITTRDLFVKVDSEKPTAGISVLTTDADNVSLSGTTLTVNENMAITFNGLKFADAEGMDDELVAGSASSDELEADDGGKGLIEKWFWSWGEEDSPDETITMEGSNNITHTYYEPGTYTLNMITTDVVGHESANATWTVVVKDIEAPVPGFIITDNESVVVTEVIEDMAFIYNASSSTSDNFDDVEDLTFVWNIDIDGTIHNETGPEMTYTFTEVGDYNVTVFVTDIAGNEANYTQVIHVNLGERPNIMMKVGSMVFDPETGTAGSTVTITVNLTNDGEVDADSVQVVFYIRNADGTDTEIGTDSVGTIAAGEDASASVEWKPSSKGDYSIWANATCAGEHSSQYWDNKIDDFSTQTVTIEEASWVLPAIVLGIIGVLIAIFFGFRYFMKSGTESDTSGDKRKKR